MFTHIQRFRNIRPFKIYLAIQVVILCVKNKINLYRWTESSKYIFNKDLLIFVFQIIVVFLC